MALIACRWPGGLNLHIKKTGVPPERWPQHRLAGPPGNLMEGVTGDPVRSPAAARQLRENHINKLKEMELTRDQSHHDMEHGVHYVENHVPDHFWREWLAQQDHFMTHVSPHTGGLVKHRVVFELNPAPEPVMPEPAVVAENAAERAVRRRAP